MRFPLHRPGIALPAAPQVSVDEATHRPAAAACSAGDAARHLRAGQARARVASPAGPLAPRVSLESLPTEVLQKLPLDARRLQLNRRLATVLHDPAVSHGFAERPPPVNGEADVLRAIERLQSVLPEALQWRDAPLAALAGCLPQVPIAERALAHAHMMRAAEACPRPVEALVALQHQTSGLPPGDRANARARIAAHPAGPLAQALIQAEGLVDPRTEMPVLRRALSQLAVADQTLVLDTLVNALADRLDLQAHDHVDMAMAHHDLPWSAAAATQLLTRVGWIPPDVQAALERRASGR